MNRVTRQPKEWDKILAIPISDKGLIFSLFITFCLSISLQINTGFLTCFGHVLIDSIFYLICPKVTKNLKTVTELNSLQAIFDKMVE